jgi:hypothetical protein
MRDVWQEVLQPFETGSSSSHNYFHIFSLIPFIEEAFIRSTVIMLSIIYMIMECINDNNSIIIIISRSQWPRGLRCRSTAARLLRWWVRILPGAWMFVVCCQVEVSATGWSLVQRSPTDYGASLCVIKNPRERGGHSPRWAAEPEKIIIIIIVIVIIIII